MPTASSVNLESVAAIQELQAGVIRYGDEVRDCLRLAARTVLETREWLDERRAYWQRQVVACEDAVREARAALETCLRGGNGDHPRDCAAHRERVRLARQRLNVAQEELLTIERWTRAVEAAALDYERSARALAQYVAHGIPVAASRLSDVLDRIADYLTVGPADAAVLPVAAARPVLPDPGGWVAPWSQTAVGPLGSPPVNAERRPITDEGEEGRDVERQRGR